MLVHHPEKLEPIDEAVDKKLEKERPPDKRVKLVPIKMIMVLRIAVPAF